MQVLSCWQKPEQISIRFWPRARTSMYKTTMPNTTSNCRDYMSIVVICSERDTCSTRQQSSFLHISRAWGLACCLASRSCARAVETSASSCLCWFSRPNASSAMQTCSAVNCAQDQQLQEHCSLLVCSCMLQRMSKQHLLTHATGISSAVSPAFCSDSCEPVTSSSASSAGNLIWSNKEGR